MLIFVGLDCGGSSSRVLAINEFGETVFQGSSGSANVTSTPESRLRRNIAAAAHGCPTATHVCGCFAGLIDAETRGRAQQIVQDLFPTAAVRVEPDYTAALKAAPEGTHICAIAGTGSLVCSVYEGRVMKSGGRGYLLGDEGSAFVYGRDALIRYLDSPETASSPLRLQVKHVFGDANEPAILSAVYGSCATAALIARFAKPLGKDALDREPYAVESVERNTSALAQVIERHVMRYHAGTEDLNVCLAGGVWKIAPCFKQALEHQLQIRLPDRRLTVGRTAQPPIYGAVQLAKEITIGN